MDVGSTPTISNNKNDCFRQSFLLLQFGVGEATQNEVLSVGSSASELRLELFVRVENPPQITKLPLNANE